MKKLTLIILVYLLINRTYSQINLVPNGSFENYSSCPTTTGQADLAMGWKILTGTPDYLNACSTTTGNCYLPNQVLAGVPNNCFGFQYASSGSAYQGFISYSSAITNFREIISVQLTNTLTIGQKYFVKFKIAFTLDGTSNTATDKTGIRFLTVQHNSVTALPQINNYSHIFTTTIVTDTSNWTTVFKAFVADSAYKYVEVGNFFNDASTAKNVMKVQASDISYYYFDDLCISNDSLFTLNFTTNIPDYHKKNEFEIFPNPSQGKIFFNKTIYEATIVLYNYLGESIKMINVDNSNQVDVNLTDGFYLMVLTENKKISTQKLIIKN